MSFNATLRGFRFCGMIKTFGGAGSLQTCRWDLHEEFNPQDAIPLVWVTGPSGSGKSTLLRLIAGVEAPDWVDPKSGGIFLNQTRLDCLPMQKRNLGWAVQNPVFFPQWSVAENLEYPLRIREGFRFFGFAKRSKIVLQARKEKVKEHLELFQLQHRSEHSPEILSGGERARLSLARALIFKPDGLLLDEPFAHLDSDLKSQLREILFHWIRKTQTPTLWVTHDEEDLKAAEKWNSPQFQSRQYQMRRMKFAEAQPSQVAQVAHGAPPSLDPLHFALVKSLYVDGASEL